MGTEITLHLGLEIDTGYADGKIYEHGEGYKVCLKLISLCNILGVDKITFNHNGRQIEVREDMTIDELEPVFDPCAMGDV